MATVRDILAKKGPHVCTTGPGATVLQATLIMAEHQVGSLLVLEGERVAGIISERDVLLRVVAEQRDPARTTVGEVMTTEVSACHPDTPLEDARAAMKNRRIRHLPVADGDSRLLGLVSIGDLNAHQTTSQEQTIHMMHEYLYGRS